MANAIPANSHGLSWLWPRPIIHPARRADGIATRYLRFINPPPNACKSRSCSPPEHEPRRTACARRPRQRRRCRRCGTGSLASPGQRRGCLGAWSYVTQQAENEADEHAEQECDDEPAHYRTPSDHFLMRSRAIQRRPRTAIPAVTARMICASRPSELAMVAPPPTTEAAETPAA